MSGLKYIYSDAQYIKHNVTPEVGYSFVGPMILKC